MIKKILYSITVLLIGFVVLTSSVYSNFYAVFEKLTAEAVSNKDYVDAEKYYSRVFDTNTMYYSGDIAEGVHLDVYAALNDYIRNEKIEEKDVTYYTIENSIQFSFFHLPETFALEDDTSDEANPKKGGVSLVFSDNKEVFFPFVTPAANHYTYKSYYNYLPLSIYEADYVKAVADAGVSETATVVSAKVIDGKGEEEYTFNFTSAFTFDTAFHTEYVDEITQYNQIQKDTAMEKEVEGSLEEILTSINDTGTQKGYHVQHSVEVIYESGAFIWKMVLTVVIYAVIAVGLGYLLFRKKKLPSKFGPRPTAKKPTNTANKNTKLPYEPEQFSRKDVFGEAVEGEFEEKPTEEVVAEEKPTEE